MRKLVKLGVVVEADDGSDAFADDEPLLALCGRASLMDRVAVGQRRGQLVATIRAAAPKVKPHGRRCAMVDGFSVHANTFVAKHARPQLEKLCRYITRPAVCNARLKRQRDGRVRVDFKSVWRNGATGKVFEPLDFIAKLVPLVAKPRVNLLRYHGQFAANAAWRSEICPGAGSTLRSTVVAAPSARVRRRRYTWSELLRRCFAVDVLRCRCGGRREVIAVINAGPVARKILRHLRLRTELPRFHPARGPPDLWAAENGDARAFNPRDHFEAA